MLARIRVDKSLLIVGAGLVIGALMGLIFNTLQETGVGYFANLLGSNQKRAPRVGYLAPDFELFDVNGKSVRLSELQGTPVFINFWATWCNPCRIEMPLIQKVVEKNPDLIVLAINADEPLQVVQQYLKQMGLTFPVLMDPGSKVEILYRVQGLPSSYFVDKKGVIQSIQIGVLSEDKLSGHLQKIGISK